MSLLGAPVGRPGKYLFKRKGSNFWWARFQYTGKLREKFGAKREFSLGTTDREEAELLVSGHIFEHKSKLFLQKSHSRTPLITKLDAGYMYEPNKVHIDKDGRELYATEEHLIYMNGDGVGTQKPNRKSEMSLAFTHQELKEVLGWLPKDTECSDDKIIADWIRIRNINKQLQREAYNTWQMFRQITRKKQLKYCKRSDGLKLVDALYEAGDKSTTVAKKIGHLRAAINLAMRDDKLKSNPFENILDKRNDSLDRDPLEDKNMDLVRSKLEVLSEQDQLLWKLLAFTGMRLGEPFQIEREYRKSGVRCVQVGTKTESSRRLVPIPTALLSQVPNNLDTPLFQGSSRAAGKRLRRLLRKLDISYDAERGTGTPKKVIQSLRHRAKDRLRDLGCPLDIQYAILGHEVKTVAAGYGHGYPMKQLLHWIDQIGY